MALALATGILFQHFFHPPGLVPLLLFLISLTVALTLRHKRYADVLLAFLFLGMGMLRFSLWEVHTLHSPILKFLPFESQSVRVVVQQPPAPGRKSFRARVRECTVDSVKVPVQRDFQVRSAAELPRSLLPGDTLLLTRVVIRQIAPPRNPGQPDYRRYLRYHGVVGEIRQNLSGTVQVVPGTSPWLAARLFHRWRRSLEQRIHRLVPTPAAGFLTAILLGEKTQLPRKVKREFQLTGVAHVLAISGLHVGFVAAIVYLLLSFLPLPFRWNYVLSMILLLGYMLLTGANPPVVRATLMIQLYLLGKLVERKPNVYNTLFLTAFLILLFQPQQLFWVSFQFSFVAVLSILLIYRRLESWQKWLRARMESFPLAHRIHQIVIVPFLVSLAAQVGTLPVTAWYFRNIPLISFLLNLLIIPLTALVVSVGFLMLLVSFIFPPLAQSLGLLTGLLIRAEMLLVHFSSHLPLAYFTVPRFPLLVMLVYLGFVGLFLFWRNPVLQGIRLPLVLFLVVLLFWVLAPRRQTVQLCMLDVGNGNATLMRTAGGSLLLFDAGPASRFRDSGRDAILPALGELGALHLHRVFLSHPHADHIGGIFSLLQDVSIDSVYLPDITVPYIWQDSLIHSLRLHQVGFRKLRAGEVVKIDESTRVYVLGPPGSFLHPVNVSGHSMNNTSLVTLVHVGDTRILFTGDAESPVERALLGWGKLLQSDVLQVGHHGSRTSTTGEFLRAVAPRIALISAGRFNRFGHPAPQVVQRLKQFSVQVYRTDRRGAIWLRWQHPQWRWWNWRER